MAVRPASATHVTTLVELMEEFYRESSYMLDREWAAASFRALFADAALGAVWLAESDGAPVGYVVLTVRFSMEFGGRDGFIDDLFVRPAHRRRRVAHDLLTALIDECRRRALLALHVEVSEDNAAAQSLYRKFGLEPRNDRRVVLTTRFSAHARPRVPANE